MRSRAVTACGVSSFGWLKWVITHSGANLRSVAQRARVTRIGSTTGARVARRIVSTVGTDRTIASTRSMRRVDITSGSPPDTMTSRTSGCARIQSMAGCRRCSLRAPPSWPTMRERVQKRQYTEHRSVARSSTRSG